MNAFSGCGIAGIMLPGSESVSENLKNIFYNMLDSLKHRGPDGSGIYCNENILLGHRRLSILDTSNRGNQPMTRDRYTITYNGEIYNFHEIRKNLQNDDFHFTSETDTEVVLRSYQKWGVNALHQFNGMFAFALYDAKEKKLLIARDRLGIKPLYYYSDNNIFIFASEIEPLLLSGYIRPEVDLKAFEHQLFATSFLETDLCRTLVKDIKSLAPGYYMNVYHDGSIHFNRYWDIPENKLSCEVNSTKLQDELELLLYDSIKLRMISDVPVSAFLSGGIDSSLINYYASGQTNEKITSITVSYADGGSDPFSNAADMDLTYSKELICQFKNSMDHKLVSLSISDITVEDIDEIIDLSSISDDDRLLSIIKNYECVKNLGFKVVLNGQGADEIMCGYTSVKYFYETMFDSMNPEKEIINKMFPTRTIVKNILNKEISFKANQVYAVVLDYYNSFKEIPSEKIHKFLTKTQLQRILKFEDFLSMRNSVECRLPYLDYRIVEFAFGIPYNTHFISGTRTGKSLLRSIARKHLSESIASRPKQAFPSYNAKEKYIQLQNIVIVNCTEIMNDELIKQYFDISKLNPLEKSISLQELWLLLVIWRWHRKLKSILN